MQWNDLKKHMRHISAKDLARIRHAFDVGKTKHEGQKRKSGEPYFTHPIAVTGILADMGADADTLIAALLHDTVEDTELTLKEIDKLFNGDVSALIDGVTKLEPEDVAESPTLDDQVETLRKVVTVMEEDVRVMVIKIVDRLHNMQTIEHLAKERQKTMAEETLDAYVKIADRLSLQEIRDELEGICLSILNPEEYKELVKIQKRNVQRGAQAIETMKNTLNLPSKISIAYERKSWGKLRVQMHTKENAATGVTALTAVLICKTIPECYDILGKLHSHWSRETLSFQDFINSPMINGYRGVHTTIILADGTRIRCKIRTEEMHEYARKGIATLCFDSQSRGFLEYLPWLKHIAPLSQDTAERSTEFWESLQNDILGESIVIHAADDRRIILPQDSTALDGAFYCYGKKALSLKTIEVDGMEMPFYTPLNNAATLSIVSNKRKTVKREWLQWVNTGLATAFIREGLSNVPNKEKQEVGWELLEKAIKKTAHVSLNELSTKALQENLKQNFGMKNIEEAYEQIAEGKLSPGQVITALLPEKTKESRGSRQFWLLRLQHPTSLSESIHPILNTIKPRFLRYKRRGSEVTIKSRYLLTPEESRIMQMQLSSLLTEKKWSLVKLRYTHTLRVAIFLLVGLWGLDPVFAHLILDTPVTAFDLTTIRFIVFFIASSLYYLSYSLLNTTKLKPIKPFKPSLILSSLTLFSTALFSYLALSFLSATEYIVYIIGFLVLGSIFTLQRNWRYYATSGISFGLLLLAGILLHTTQQTSLTALVFAATSALSFSFYSYISSRYQQEVEHIQARYPAYLFWLSIISLPFVVCILPQSTLGQLPMQLIAITTLFVLIFTIVPYAIYFECMRRIQMHRLVKALPFVSIWAIGGDVLLGNLSGNTLLIAALLLASIVFLLFNRTLREAQH